MFIWNVQFSFSFTSSFTSAQYIFLNFFFFDWIAFDERLKTCTKKNISRNQKMAKYLFRLHWILNVDQIGQCQHHFHFHLKQIYDSAWCSFYYYNIICASSHKIIRNVYNLSNPERAVTLWIKLTKSKKATTKKMKNRYKKCVGISNWGTTLMALNRLVLYTEKKYWTKFPFSSCFCFISMHKFKTCVQFDYKMMGRGRWG